MAVIHRNVGGSYTMLNTDVGTAAAAHWFIADSFAFGVDWGAPAGLAIREVVRFLVT